MYGSTVTTRRHGLTKKEDIEEKLMGKQINKSLLTLELRQYGDHKSKENIAQTKNAKV